MILTINHITEYTYENPIKGLVQTTKLIPSDYEGLKVIKWDISMNSGDKGIIYTDFEGNNIQSFTNYEDTKNIKFVVSGKVETSDTSGIYRSKNDKIDKLVYLRETEFTKKDISIENLALKARELDQQSLLSPTGIPAKLDSLKSAHNLLTLIADEVDYVPLSTNTSTTAIKAYKQKKGVCQDHAHIMISAAKVLGIPARYVNGYMHNNKNDSKYQATHAWAELYINDLGWVGFDPTNRCCPDERYIRVSCGLDSSYAAPIRGIVNGGMKESLDIDVQTLEVSTQ
ncbi:transglutaminase family protein [Pelagibacteraceae bacterium]|nr:transglutaminase family protein [Pelagibacteraceae bacterium]